MSEDKAKILTDQVLDKVLEFSEDKLLFDCGMIVVGLSGGPDSVALLYILNKLKERRDIGADIVAFHCNHHLRPEVCDKEADQVRVLCSNLGIGLKVLDFDCAGFAKLNRISEETAGRVLRYEAFEQYAQMLERSSGKAVRVAIAHHKDDVAETMMMNLFRGSGLEGLVSPKSMTGRIIRPLLCLNKSELVHMLESNNIEFATDLTNLQAIGTRNVWRNVLLPEIGELYNENPAVPLARTYKLLSDDLDFISSYTAQAYEANRTDISGFPVIFVSGVEDLHPAVRSRIIRSLWLETFGNLTDFEESNLKDCLDLTGGEHTGETVIDMPFGRKAYRHGDIFAFVNGDEVAKIAGALAGEKGFLVSDGPVNLEIDRSVFDQKKEVQIDIPNSSLILKIRIIENTGELEYNNSLWFCPVGTCLEGRITIANCEGSGTALRMRKAGSGSSKDINRLMTDLKIPESSRKHILFVSDNEDVLWLPGFGHSIGFTGAVSREKYIAGIQSEGKAPDTLAAFAIERR